MTDSERVVYRLAIQMDQMTELVAEGASIQEAGRQIGVDRGRACKIWRRVRQKLGPQAV